MNYIKSIAPFVIGLGLAMAFGWGVFPILLYGEENQPMTFDHSLHTGSEVGMSCEDCHGFDEKGNFLGIPSLESCKGCHEGGENLKGDNFYLTSHMEKNDPVPWLVYSRQPDGAYFSHAEHVLTAKISCEKCHGDHGKTKSLRPLKRNRISGYSADIWGPDIHGFNQGPPRSMKMTDCENCHAQKGVLGGCLTCHK